MRFLKATFFVQLLIFVGVASAWSQSDGSSGVVAAVEAKYAKVNVIQAGFVQKIESAVFGVEEQKGQMVIKRPAMMRWNFASGERQFVTNGEMMWVYSREKNQVIRYKDVSATRSDADTLLQSLDSLQKSFNVEVAPKKEGGHLLQLTPKGETKQFTTLQLQVDKALLIQSVVIVDGTGTRTTLLLSDVKLNQNVLDKTFEFSIPEGAQVIDGGGY